MVGSIVVEPLLVFDGEFVGAGALDGELNGNTLPVFVPPDGNDGAAGIVDVVAAIEVVAPCAEIGSTLARYAMTATITMTMMRAVMPANIALLAMRSRCAVGRDHQR